ncbi:FimV/HubP family polar landmark protein [Methylomagnum sp.]
MGANALGVGDIRLHSALNQSLDAEIPLVLSGADSLSDVRVSLASPEAYTKAGLERHYFLTKLQFSPAQTANGTYVIKVSSRDVMREPFLNFLVEVNWPQGRVVREFTALLDPPASMQGEAVAETEPAMVERPVRRYERVAEISRSGDVAPPVRRSAQRTVSAAPPVAAPAAPPPSEEQLTNEAYGPVRRDESLWGIAKALNNDASLTHEQMVMGLYRANPQAFARGVNSLKAGATLRMPTREFIAQLSPPQARIEYARQQGWNTSRMAGARIPQLAEGEGPQNQLKLLAPADTKGQGTASQAGGGKGRGDLALEVAETAKQENEELRSRLAQLEQKLSEMQRKLSIKDEEIATLQTQPHGTAATPPPAELPPPKSAAPQAVTPPPQAQPSAVTPPSPQPPVAAPTAGQPTPSLAPESPKPGVTPPQPAPPPKPKPAPTPPVVTPAPEASDWMTDPTYLGIAGSAVILGVTALLIRRRRNAIIAETESILIAAERASRQASLGGAGQFSTIRPTSAEPAVEPIAAPKSSFLSEFTPSDFDTLGSETDEVDPISEADVYLAYGRYKQAEELIRHAISQHPERDECKLKLLEIYHTTENRAAYENYAKELKAQRKDGQPEFWNKVVEMGRELAPGSALFQGSASASPKAADKSFDSTMGLGSLDLSDDLIDDLKRFEIEFSEPSLSGDGDTDLIALDFGSSADDLGTPVVKPGEAERFAALDFDLASLGISKPKASTPAPAKAAPKPEAAPELDNLLAFDFGSPAPKPQAPPEESYEEQADKTIDDILRDLTDSLKQEEPAPKPEPTSPAAGGDLSLSGLGFDLSLFEQSSLGLAETEATAEMQEESGDLYAGLTDMDQVETKLDLAKAYADMEDEESASEILQDVLATGNDKQKAEARQLLSKMGKADAA